MHTNASTGWCVRASRPDRPSPAQLARADLRRYGLRRHAWPMARSPQSQPGLAGSGRCHGMGESFTRGDRAGAVLQAWCTWLVQNHTPITPVPSSWSSAPERLTTQSPFWTPCALARLAPTPFSDAARPSPGNPDIPQGGSPGTGEASRGCGSVRGGVDRGPLGSAGGRQRGAVVATLSVWRFDDPSGAERRVCPGPADAAADHGVRRGNGGVAVLWPRFLAPSVRAAVLHPAARHSGRRLPRSGGSARWNPRNRSQRGSGRYRLTVLVG